LDHGTPEKTPDRETRGHEIERVTGPVAQSWPNGEAFGGVEDLLAVAIARACAAGRWDIVAQLARELEARRLAASGVATLNDARRTRR
jgi:hypothetical protein